MLVLSRKEDQTIIFPNLGISIEVVKVQGNKVSLGVEAPKEIRVLRGELQSQTDSARDDSVAVFQTLAQLIDIVDPAARHELRNRLNTARLSVYVAQRQIEMGGSEEAQKLLVIAVEALYQLNKMFDSNLGNETLDSVIESRPKYEVGTGRLMNCKVLVVEDNDNERELLAGVLEMAGCEVFSVADGKEAIEFIEMHGQPDVILMDMNMPRLNGPETIAEIRKKVPGDRLPIFGVSGMTQAEVNIPVSDRGLTGWFTKPVNPNQLVRYLQQQLAGHN